MTDALPAPLIVLSAHRSGSSSVMGLLVGIGLQVGEVLPPQADNPKGFFESVAVVNENRRLLASMDRDWTCPPRALDQSAIDRERLEVALGAVVDDRARPWGFKDPRTIFTLEAWLSVLENVRLLGVYRSASSVARSLETRDLFSQTAAESIANLYNERLAQLHQELRFPIVHFGGDGDVLLDQMKDISRQLDLGWEPQFAKSFFDTGLIHHTRSDGLGTADQYLESVVDATVDLATWSSHDVFHALKRVESDGRFTPASPYLGPQFLVRRTRLWRIMRKLSGEIGRVLELVPDDRRQLNPLDGSTPEQYQRQGLAQVPDLESPASYTHILATDALDVVAPDDLDGFLAELLTMTGFDGVVGLSGGIVDDAQPPDAPNHLSDARGGLHNSGYRHQRDDLEDAIRRLGWSVATWRADLNLVVLARSASRADPSVLTPSELRTRLVSLERRLSESERDCEKLRKALASSQRDYTRLRSRRLVRFSLAVARPFKPVFEWARSGGVSSSTKADTTREAEQYPKHDQAEVPYVHVRAATGNGHPTSLIVPRPSDSTRSGTRSLAVDAAPIQVGLFVPASKSSFPPSTHVRVLRRFFHGSVEQYLSPVVLNAERYLAADSPMALDLAVVQRTGVPAGLTDAFLSRLRDRGIPLILDLDDDIIGIPATHPDFEAFRDWREPLKRLATRADLITASTEALRQRLAGYNSNVVTVVNALDSELWFSIQHEREGHSSRRTRDSFRLLYFGSRTHEGDLQLLEEFIRRPANATALTVIGGAPIGTLDWCEHLDPPAASREYPQFVQWLRDYATGFDAVVAPLADTPFNEAKSDLKFLEGAALGLPVICSDVTAYATLRERGVALLCGPTPREWGEAMTSFRDQPELRSALAQAGNAYVQSERLLEQQSVQVVKLVGELVPRAGTSP